MISLRPRRQETQESINDLYSRNYDSVLQYNNAVFPTLMLIATLLMAFTTLWGLMGLTGIRACSEYVARLPIYGSCLLVSVLLYFLTRCSRMYGYINILMYFGFAEVFVIAIILSVVSSPTQRATIIMGSFCLMPMCCIDKPWRTGIFIAFFYILHTVLSFIMKGPALGVDDAINCISFVILGMFVGIAFVRIKLESFEAKRLLIIEKETDVLTGLNNRRRLVETLVLLETPESEKPSGVLMMDVDKFKEYNDRYGHAAGDECLRRIGEVMREFEMNYRMSFYRYGGEEFVAFLYGYDDRQLFSIAESIRSAVGALLMGDGAAGITMSIGVAECGNEYIKNYENWIDNADKAAYYAKAKGRNVTVSFRQMQNDIESAPAAIPQ